MIALNTLPPGYTAWNAYWGAPRGRLRYRRLPLQNSRPVISLLGPFAWQGNSVTRTFEYPWVYDQISANGKPLTIVELGGSLAGMQFVLAAQGHRVINVDPGLQATGIGWDLDLTMHQRLSQAFRAPVEVIPTTIDQANLSNALADVVLCISAFEHFSQEDIECTCQHIPRILKPGGIAVFTVDLFLDLAPFTDQASNRWGRNLDVAKFLADSNLTLQSGCQSELLGYPSFSPKGVLSKLSQYIYEPTGPCLSQCMVAKLRC